MAKNPRKLYNLLMIFVLFIIGSALSSCGGGSNSAAALQLNAKAITAYSLNGTPGIISGRNISVTMPYGTNITNLIATFTTTGNHVTVGENVQVSGQTANNFTNPVKYVVTAADGSTRIYTVIVSVAPIDSKLITAYSLNGTSGTISGNNISVTMPYGTPVNSLVATFTTTVATGGVTVNGTVQISGKTANNFTNPVTYLVTAADGSTRNYIVTVNVAASDSKSITTYSLTDDASGETKSGLISGNNISVKMPFGTNVTKLVATFTTTVAAEKVTVNGKPQISGITENDFTNPVTYLVTAADGSTRNYIVTVNVAPQYAYITNYNSNSYTQCQIDHSTGNLSSCNTITPSGSGALNNPWGIAINGSYAYIINNFSNSYTKCNVDTITGNLSSCNTFTPSAPGALSSPSGITINNGYAYITNYATNSYTQCNIDSTTGILSPCNTYTPNVTGSISQMTINNGFAYFTNSDTVNNNYYTVCTVISTSGNLSLCNTITSQNLNGSTAIEISGGYAYIIGQSTNSYTRCSVNSENLLSSCASSTPTAPGALNAPFGITINNGFAYIVNFTGNSYTQCNINQNGGLSNCNTITPSGQGTLANPSGIFIN